MARLLLKKAMPAVSLTLKKHPTPQAKMTIMEVQ